jgi:hypothetical protein
MALWAVCFSESRFRCPLIGQWLQQIVIPGVSQDVL